VRDIVAQAVGVLIWLGKVPSETMAFKERWLDG